MKKTFVWVMLASLLTASSAFAAQGEWLGGGHAGVHMPMGDYSDLADPGFVGGVSIEYMLTEMFGLGAVLAYHGTKAKDEFAEALLADDINVSVFQYGVNGRLAFSTTGPFIPYAQGGLGMYNVKAEVEGGPGDGADESETKFGVNGGLGFLYRPATSAVGFGIEGAIHHIPDAFTDDADEEIAAQFFTIVGKVVFSFSDMSQQR